MSHPLYIVDVFAERKYAGNQLAVVRHAADLDTDTMQDIAREMHFAETTFILSDEARDGGYDVRIFTPEAEVPFAGHPTLGTSFVIQREIIGKPVPSLTLNLKVGQIPVTFDDKLLWMKQNAPMFGATCSPADVAPVLNLDVGDFDTRFPIQEVSTGLEFLLVPLKTLDAVRRARVNQDRLKSLIATLEAKMIFLFAPETYHNENQINARMFADVLGVPEDPATGSANGCLAGYLVKYRYFGSNEINVRVEQGYEIKRPSLLLLRASEMNGRIDVNVGGQVFLVGRGELE
ncbi:MAG TPA: PhzF family phenazine biosynthesis protein [Anaerolineae bacterium]|nr:PhzF family phenazine biosynthesis protein [Anaerolineae bacterium]